MRYWNGEHNIQKSAGDWEKFHLRSKQYCQGYTGSKEKHCRRRTWNQYQTLKMNWSKCWRSWWSKFVNPIRIWLIQSYRAWENIFGISKWTLAVFWPQILLSIWLTLATVVHNIITNLNKFRHWDTEFNYTNFVIITFQFLLHYWIKFLLLKSQLKSCHN